MDGGRVNESAADSASFEPENDAPAGHSAQDEVDVGRFREVLAEIKKGADRPLDETAAWRVVLELADRPEMRLPLAWALIKLLGHRTRAPSGQTVADLLERVVDEYEKGVEPPADSSSARSFLRWLSGARLSHLLDVPAPARSRRRPARPKPEPVLEAFDDDLEDFEDLAALDVPEKSGAGKVAPRPVPRPERGAAADDPLDEAEQAVKRLRAIPFRRS
jgi:hypothetical protein